MSIFYAVPKNTKTRFVWFRNCGKVCGGFSFYSDGITIEFIPSEIFIYSEKLRFSFATYNYKFKFHRWDDWEKLK
jgi:hypothetical protein